MTRKHASTYTRFLQFVEEVRKLEAFPKLDAVEERLLSRLAASWYAGDRVPVLRAMTMFEDVSGTTIHRRLKSLRRKGMIELQPDETDDRIRYVAPTELANQYFERLGRCLDKATRD